MEAYDKTALEARVSELEVKLGFAEELIDTLNRSIFRQQEQIDLLQQELRQLYRQLREEGAGGRGEAGDELPPHY